jgi:hypothetical protein
MADIEEKFPRALWVRLVIYLAVGHLFAAFIWLLFEVGAKERPSASDDRRRRNRRSLVARRAGSFAEMHRLWNGARDGEPVPSRLDPGSWDASRLTVTP